MVLLQTKSANGLIGGSLLLTANKLLTNKPYLRLAPQGSINAVGLQRIQSGGEVTVGHAKALAGTLRIAQLLLQLQHLAQLQHAIDTRPLVRTTNKRGQCKPASIGAATPKYATTRASYHA